MTRGRSLSAVVSLACLAVGTVVGMTVAPGGATAAPVVSDVAGSFEAGSVEAGSVESAGATSSTSYQAVPVARLFDTRGDADAAIQVATGKLNPGTPLATRIAGVAGLPVNGIAAVDLNIAVTAVEGQGFLSVYPCADGNDGTARLNFTRRPELGASAIAVQVLAQLDVDGMVCIEASQRAHVVVDTSGYLPDGGPLRPIPATRLFDTRDGSGAVQVPAAQPTVATPLVIGVAGVAGVPTTGASAVLLSVAAARGASTGFVSVFPCTAGFRGTASLNFRAAAPVANSVIAPIDENGEICFYTSAPVDLIVDISAWFATNSPFSALSPTRAADTRDGTGGLPIAKLNPFTATPVPLAAVGGVPARGADAVSLNVAVARSTAPGFLAIFPCDEEWNGTASLNFQTGEPLSNATLTPIADDGTACVLASEPVDVIIDVNGWFGADVSAADDAVTVQEDSGPATIDVLANDAGPTSITAVTQPANGTAAITEGARRIGYTPRANYCNGGNGGGGPDSFTYTITGGSTATVSVTVTCVDDPPTAVDDALTVAEDAAPTVINVLGNDTDIDAGPIAVTSVTQPADGTVVVTNGGADLTYEPDPETCNDGSPTDDFVYTIQPGNSSATVAVTVMCVDDAPVAIPDVFASDSTSPGGPNDRNAIGNTTLRVGVAPGTGPERIVSGSLLDNDADAEDGGSITVVSVQGGTLSEPTDQGGTVTANADGTFVYEPPLGYEGVGPAADSFSYTIEDTTGTSAVGSAVIEIVGVVWYVDSSASTNGDGRGTDPFIQLVHLNGFGGTPDVDEPGDTIFLYRGTSDGTTPNSYDTGMVMEAGQRLIGESAGLTVDGTPLVASSPGNADVNNVGGHGVVLADDVLVDGISTIDSSVGGFFADSVGGITLRNIAHSGTGDTAVRLLDLTASVAIEGPLAIDGAAGTAAVEVEGSVAGADVTFQQLAISDTAGPGLRLIDNDGDVTISNGSISGVGGYGLVKIGGSGDLTYDGTIGVPNSNGGAALIGADGGDVIFNGQVSDENGFGLVIDNAPGATIHFTESITLTGSPMTVEDAPGATVTFDDTVTLVGDGLEVVATGVGPTVTFAEFVDIDTTNTNAVRLNQTAGNTATIDFDGGLDIDTTIGSGIVATKGTLNIADHATNAETIATTAGRALSMTDTSGSIVLDSTTVTAASNDAVVVSGIENVDLGVVNLTGLASLQGLMSVSDAMSLSTSPGSSVTSTGGSALKIVDVTTVDATFASVAAPNLPANVPGVLLSGLDIGSFDVTGTVSASGLGDGVSMNGVSIPVTIDTLNTTVLRYGVSIANSSGDVTIDGGSIAGVDMVGFIVDGGSGDVSYGGTISNTSGRTVQVTSAPGPRTGLITFSGLVDENEMGILIGGAGDDGVRFEGGLDIDNTVSASVGFFVTSTVASPSTVTVVDTPLISNTIDSAPGTRAIQIEAAAGTDGITFESISGTATGAFGLGTARISVAGPGTFRVTGDGDPGSGGLITGDTTSDAVEVVNSSAAVVLTDMTIEDSTGRAVSVVDSDDVTIETLTVTDFGGDSAVHVTGLNNPYDFTLTGTPTGRTTINQSGTAAGIGVIINANHVGVPLMPATAIVDHTDIANTATGIRITAQGNALVDATIGDPGVEEGTPTQVIIAGTTDAAVSIDKPNQMLGLVRALLDGVLTIGAGGGASDRGVWIDANDTSGAVDVTIEDSNIGFATAHGGSAIDIDAVQSLFSQVQVNALVRRTEASGLDALDVEASAAPGSTSDGDLTVFDSDLSGGVSGTGLTVAASGSAALCIDVGIDGPNTIGGGIGDVDVVSLLPGTNFAVEGLGGTETPTAVEAWFNTHNTDGNDTDPLEASVTGTYADATAQCATPLLPST